MASPFAVFRKNQKVMLAFVAIAAIGAFVFLDPVMRYVGGGNQPQNPVVVETRYGDLTQSQLESLLYQRDLVDRFLRLAIGRAVAAQINQPNLDARWLDNFASQQYRGWYERLLRRSSEGPEAAAVETMVLAKRAENMGMVVSDQAINNLIQQITADSLPADEIKLIVQNVQPARPISIRTLFGALRTEMLASTYQQLFFQSLNDIPPAQRFEYYSRLNRRAKAEVLSLAVADFLAQVPEPQEAELKEFYNKYKNDYPNPESPEPGFKEPQRATFQYFKANLDETAKKLEPQITEEEIKKYYEENKSQFIAFEDNLGAPDAKAAEGAPADAESAKPEAKEEAKDEAKPEESQPKTDDTEKPAAEAPPAETPAEPKGETPAAPPDEAPKAEPPAEATPQSNVSPRGKFLLVSTVAQETAPAEQPAEQAPAETPPAETPAPEASTEPAPADKPAEAPAAEAPAADARPADAPAGKPADAPADKPADAPAADAAAPKPEPKFEPLEKVQDQIRTSLARQKAAELLQGQFEELTAKMKAFADEWDLYITDKGTNPNLKPPAPFDFAKLAEGKEVVARELVSISPLEAAKEDIGQAERTVINPATGARFAAPFIQFAFADTLPEYKSEQVADNDNNFYLFWKTAQEPPYVPPFDQVRERVVRAWKMIRARELAQQRADEYAKQARSLKQPLSELFGKQANLKVEEFGPFSWMTFGNVPTGPGAMPHLTDIEGLDQAGPGFMGAVFGLEPGGVGVAFNEPRDTVYVVRAVDFEPPMEELRDQFARESPNRYLAASTEDQRKIFRAWIEDVNRDADVSWVRQADARREAEEAGL